MKRLGILAMSALFSTGVLAGSDVSFSELDRDDDGVVTQDEAKGSQLEQSFQQADQDKDQNISEAEFALFKEQKEIKEEGGGQSGGGGGGSQ